MMTRNKASEISRALIEIVWHFGPRGLDGECCENLSMPEYLALEKVTESSDCAVQDIGVRLGFTKSGATRVVNRLVKKGYVQKIKSHEDGRVCCVLATEAGRKVLTSTHDRYSRQLEQLFSRMPEQLVPDMEELLKTLARAARD